MKKRIFAALLLVALLVGLLYSLLLAAALPEYTRRRTIFTMQSEMALLRNRAQQQGGLTEDYLNSIVSLYRISLIAPEGRVLYDSQADAEALDSHRDRPEILEALREGTGSASRPSETSKETLLYFAQRQPEVRLSFGEMLPYLLGGLLLSLIAAALLSALLSRAFTRAIGRIDLDRPMDAQAYEELSPLLGRLNEQNRRIGHQMDALMHKQSEMDALLDGMSEGFVALDPKKRIISINHSAARMLSTEPMEAIGRTLPEISRKPEIMQLLDELFQDGSASATLQLDARSYALSANIVKGSGSAVLLMRDVTQMMEGDAMRKRFTANVSHELRTPLTAICGYAEMLEGGMVRKEDVQGMLGRISDESKRMLALVEDILRLSKLDEGYPGGQFKRLDLHEAAGRAIRRLSPLAAQKEVKLSLSGEKLSVMGDPTLLDELINNLIDNAIKYNRPGGKVELFIEQGAHSVDLVVKDSGLGIDPSQQERIFERFYRTDSSRSKETGGTGLGLSIVKHSAEYHRAKLSLSSQPGQGTTICVSFPKSAANDGKKNKQRPKKLSQSGKH